MWMIVLFENLVRFKYVIKCLCAILIIYFWCELWIYSFELFYFLLISKSIIILVWAQKFCRIKTTKIF